MENLRLLCPKCNLSRKRQFSYDEIIAFSCEPDAFAENRGESPQVAALIQSNPIQIESESKSKESVKRFAPPAIEEVEKYCRERGNNINAQYFIDYYSSNGWKVGKNPMKDWKATIRRWEQNGFDKQTVPKGSPAMNNYAKPDMDRMKKMIESWGGES